jgi:hypothetical protein
MVCDSVVDQALVSVLSELVKNNFLSGRTPSDERIRRVWARRLSSKFKTLPSTLDRKKGGISRRIQMLSDLLALCSPGKSGRFPQVAIPNGWQNDRFDHLIGSVNGLLVNCSSELVKKLTKRRRVAHVRLGKCSPPRNLTEIDAATSALLIEVAQRDLARSCLETRQRADLALAKATWNGILCLLRFSDNHFSKNYKT